MDDKQSATNAEILQQDQNQLQSPAEVTAHEATAEIQSQPAESADAAETPQPQPESDKRHKYGKFAIIGIVLALAAWVALAFDGHVAWALSVLAIVSSCFGLKAPRGSLRNTAAMALVASAVLLIVVSAFLLLFLIGI